MWVTSRYASGFVFEIEVMGSLLALNAVIIGIQVDAWLLSAPGAQGAQGPSDGPVGCPRFSPGCKPLAACSGETPEDILEQGIHLNQFVRKTHNLDLDKNQETILCQLMLHPSRYRAIRFHCGSFRLKQLSSAEVKRSLSQMLSLSYHCWRSFSHSCCPRPEEKKHGNNMK